jgi:tetratricopeptide (TPR) repeat protein
MDPSLVDWRSSLIVVAAALFCGAALVYWLRRAPARAFAPERPLDVRDLIARRDALLGQLRELLDAAGKRTKEQLAQERFALEVEAARVLRALDRAEAAAPATPAPQEAAAPEGEPRPPGLFARNPALRGFAWGMGSMVALALLVYFAQQGASPREEGGTVTGNTPRDAAPGEARSPDAEEAALRSAIAKNPDDLDARVALARVHLRRQDMMGVWDETKYVLARSPDHPEALSYQSLVRLAMGQPQVAEEMLKRVLAAHPGHFEAHVHLALVYARMGRLRDAEALLADASRRFPAQAGTLAQVLTELRAEPPLPDQPAEGDPHAGVGPPGVDAPSPAPQAAAPPAQGAQSVAGSIDLDPSLRGQVGSGGVLFVMLREAGFGAGPPAAVKRIPVSSFPVSFEIGAADSMSGEAIPREVLIEARLDADGDPVTRPPTDPKARLDDVKVGRRDLRLVLARP